MLKVNRALIYHVDNEMHWNNVAINNTNCITKSTYFLSPFCKFFLITDSFRLALCSLLLLRCYMCGAYVHLILLFFRDFMKFSLFSIVCIGLLSIVDLISIFSPKNHISCYSAVTINTFVINFVTQCSFYYIQAW